MKTTIKDKYQSHNNNVFIIILNIFVIESNKLNFIYFLFVYVL